ncbi:MAG: RNA polymerase sigma factor [Anaerohalosphaera sp.]|nr:RNA polymerase sigma factor [Anaerohalosphaera sp.]
MTNTNDQTDANLMANLASGNNSALATLADRYHKKIITLAYRMLNNRASAEDIAQETFLRVLRSAKSYKPDAKFSTWLYRIAVNLCIDAQRKASSRNISLDAAQPQLAANQPPSALQQAETTQIVQNAIQNLPQRQKTAIILHRYDNLTHAQISEVTGWTKSATESLLVRAYANLREKLKHLQDFQ